MSENSTTLSSAELAGLKPEDLLGLDDVSLAWRRNLIAIADSFYAATLFGNSGGPYLVPPHIERIRNRLSTPQIGDYVYEANTWGLFPDDLDFFARASGILKSITTEPLWSEASWAEEIKEYETAEEPIPERPKATQRVYYIQNGPTSEDITRWENASFRVVPLGEQIF